MQLGSEFLSLCEEQINLLANGLGASFAVVAMVEQPQTQALLQDVVFLPAITYPEAFKSIDPTSLMSWIADLWAEESMAADGPYASEGYETENYKPEDYKPKDYKPKTYKPDSYNANNYSANNYQADNYNTTSQDSYSQPFSPASAYPPVNTYPASQTTSPQAMPPTYPLETDPQAVSSSPRSTLSPRSAFGAHHDRLVIPLVYKDLMVGLLVTVRVDRGWTQLEQYDIQRIAHTIAAACVLDQRSQWLEQRLHQQSTAYNRLYEHQQDLLGDVLHQFRNPLTAVRTFGKLLLKRLQPHDRNRAVAESIVRESDRLQDLLQQLSAAATLPSPSLPGGPYQLTPADSPSDATAQDTPDLLLLEATAPPAAPLFAPGSPEPLEADPVKALTGHSLQLQPLPLMEVLQPLLISAQAIAQDRGIALQCETTSDLPPVWADEKAVREVLNNLIDNALKYTPAGGQVHIVVGLDSTGPDDASPAVGTAIIDSGPGIPAADQVHLFQRHFRGVQADGDIPGTGLGLAIAQQLVQHMQGHIEVFSPVDSSPDSVLDPIHAFLEQGSPDPDASPQGRGAPPAAVASVGTLFIVWLPMAGEHAPPASQA